MSQWKWVLTLAFWSALVFGCSQTKTPVEVNTPIRHTQALQPAAASTGFHFYLLNLSWSPEFCHSHATAAECAQHLAFVLHGLWPERADGTYPENCSNAPGPANPSQYSDIYPDAGLLQHEWRTHGTCSGLSADSFFSQARAAMRKVNIPARFSELQSQASLSPNDIKTAFAQSNPALSTADIAISCGNNYLTAVEVCLDKTLTPTSCGAVKTCHANMVKVPAP